jgi:transposase-like protein
VLVELSVMEQRYQAVLAVVQDGWQVSEVARRLGVSRQASTPGSSATSEEAWLGSRTARTDRAPAHTRPIPRSRRRSANCGASIRAGDRAGSSTSSGVRV